MYIRNTVNNADTQKQHAGYYIYKTELVEYFKEVFTPLTGLTRSLILPNDLSFYINIHNQVLTGNIITLERDLRKPSTQIFQWDRSIASTLTNTLNGANHYLAQTKNSFNWFMRASANSLKQFERVWLKTDNTMGKITVQIHADYVDKAISPGKKCAILYRTTTSSEALKIYNFDPASGTVATQYSDITTLITIANISTTDFQVSDDCSMIRILSKFYYWDATLGTPAFVQITDLPTGTNVMSTLPGSSYDFNYVVAASGIYKYTSKAGATPAKYSFALAGTHYFTKKIFKFGDNLIVLSYQATAGDANLYNFKVNIVTLYLSNLRLIQEFTGLTPQPEIICSDKLTKIVASITELNSNLFQQQQNKHQIIKWKYIAIYQ